MRSLTDRAVLAAQRQGIKLFGSETRVVVETVRKLQKSDISMSDVNDIYFSACQKNLPNGTLINLNGVWEVVAY